MTKTATIQRGPGQEPSEAFNAPVNPAPNKQSKEDTLEVTGQVSVNASGRQTLILLCCADGVRLPTTSSLILGLIYPKILAGGGYIPRHWLA